MNKLEDLQTLMRLLKEFEFPVSPILEYAIKEKMEQLSSADENPVSMPVVEIEENEGMLEVSVRPSSPKKKKPSILRVIRADGTIIERAKAGDAFCQTIKEVGLEKVFLMKIPMDNMHLITIGGNPQYPTDQRDMGNGYFVNVHSNTPTKKRQLEKIFKALNLNWKVEVIEPDNHE